MPMTIEFALVIADLASCPGHARDVVSKMDMSELDMHAITNALAGCRFSFAQSFRARGSHLPRRRDLANAEPMRPRDRHRWLVEATTRADGHMLRASKKKNRGGHKIHRPTSLEHRRFLTAHILKEGGQQ